MRLTRLPFRRHHIRTLTAALVGILLVVVPTSVGLYWHLEVETDIAQALAARIGRRVIIGSARPLLSGGIRLGDVVVFGAPPFSDLPLLQAGAIDVDLGWRAALAGRIALGGFTLHGARFAVVRDALHKTDNLGDLVERVLHPHGGAALSAAAAGAPGPRVRLEDGSLQIAYRDHQGLRWVVRADGLHARVKGGQGTLTAARLRIEAASAACEFSAARFELEGTQIRRAEASSGRLALAGAENLIAGGRMLAQRDPDPEVGWHLRAQAPRMRLVADVGPFGIRGSVEADHLPLAPLRPLGDPVGVGTAGATLDALLEVRYRPAADALGVEGRAEVAGLVLTHPRVTSGVVTGARLAVTGSGVAAPRQGRLAVDQATLRMGDLTFWLHGSLDGLRDTLRAQIEAKLEPVQCQAALDSLPAGLAPALEGTALSGTVAGSGKIRFDVAHPRDLTLDIDVKDRCTVLRDPPSSDVTRLRAPEVAYRVDDGAGHVQDFLLGPANPDWRPLRTISPHLIGAFLTAEDARFYSHHGFEPDMIQHALIEDLEKRRFARGASTISQQLIKNLFLEQARTFSRKLQETVLTWRLEQVIGKRRILELYLNAIELGPGTYGVRQAARRYFGKEPGALTPLEAAHLASVAPNPKGYWAHFRRGAVEEEWMEKLYDLLGMMRRSHRLSEVDFAEAVSQQLRFKEL